MTTSERNRLRARAHHLKPVVIVGQAGITSSLLRELTQALEHHELMKVRLMATHRSERSRVAQHLCSELGAELVQVLGHVVTLYRPNPHRSASDIAN